ncbi:linear gramicidin synthetase subunit D domain protein [Mycobacterium xenopi 4042]|uniref:Linear gramicidin synthetase subunit D domain protein n=1 Tax=Mycobacterium xenopi 4042 TaxID=1299334 RepID=X8AJP9_MYCXE|nr:linear gramicidin synthetase subunit D domain protein [Mycobacterium xenopi 4042]
MPLPDPDDVAYLIYTSAPRGAQERGHRAPQRDRVVGSLDATCRAGGCGATGIRWRSTCRCGRSSAPCCGVAAGGDPGVGDSLPDDVHDVLVNERVEVLTATPSAVAILSPEGWNRWRWSRRGACPSEVVTAGPSTG